MGGADNMKIILRYLLYIVLGLVIWSILGLFIFLEYEINIVASFVAFLVYFAITYILMRDYVKEKRVSVKIAVSFIGAVPIYFIYLYVIPGLEIPGLITALILGNAYLVLFFVAVELMRKYKKKKNKDKNKKKR